MKDAEAPANVYGDDDADLRVHGVEQRRGSAVNGHRCGRSGRGQRRWNGRRRGIEDRQRGGPRPSPKIAERSPGATVPCARLAELVTARIWGPGP